MGKGKKEWKVDKRDIKIGSGMEKVGISDSSGGKREMESRASIRKGEVIASSDSVSEFDFGFSDASGSGTNAEEQVGESSGLEEEDVDVDGIVEIDRVSPQLALPDLDVHIRGIEGLTVLDK